jgi:hypothetical protein
LASTSISVSYLQERQVGLVDTAGQVMVEPQLDEPVYFTPSLRGVAWAAPPAAGAPSTSAAGAVPGIACADADPMGRPTGQFQCKVEPWTSARDQSQKRGRLRRAGP